MKTLEEIECHPKGGGERYEHESQIHEWLSGRVRLVRGDHQSRPEFKCGIVKDPLWSCMTISLNVTAPTRVGLITSCEVTRYPRIALDVGLVHTKINCDWGCWIVSATMASVATRRAFPDPNGRHMHV